MLCARLHRLELGKNMRTLYQFPLSHYCEKARWLLDHKELDFVAKNLFPGLHRPLTRWKTSKDTLPMLKDGKVWIADSTEIALYLDGQYPEYPLISRDPALRSATIEIDRLADQLGIHVRRWMYLYLIDEPHTMTVMFGETGLASRLRPLLTPVVKKGVRQLYGIWPEKAARSKVKLDDLINQIEARLIKNGGRYLVGNQLGLADIAVCSLAAPLFGMVGTPWEAEAGTVIPAPIAELQQALLARPFGQYVMRVYDNERNARVDWHGQ
jgi:glutathione S-transferase